MARAADARRQAGGGEDFEPQVPVLQRIQPFVDAACAEMRFARQAERKTAETVFACHRRQAKFGIGGSRAPRRAALVVAVEIKKLGADEGAMMTVQQFDLSRQFIRMPAVVIVEKGDVFAARRIQAEIARARPAESLGDIDERHRGRRQRRALAGLELAHHLLGVVITTATVGDDDDFNLRVALREDAAQCLAQQRRAPVSRHNHADQPGYAVRRHVTHALQ